LGAYTASEEVNFNLKAATSKHSLPTGGDGSR
jgi:hypothetical protein